MKAKRILSTLVALIFMISLVGTMQLSVLAEGESLANLTWSDIANNQIKSFVVKDLNLMTTLNGEVVTWESSKPAVISAAGKVTRTNNAESVTLTATSGDATKSFDVVVQSIFAGDVKVSYTFDNLATGTSALTAYSNFTATVDDKRNVSDYKVIADTIDSDANKALVADVNVGFKKYTAEQKEALLASSNVLTYVNGSDTYTYYLEAEPKTNATGTYFNGLLYKNGNIVDNGYYIGVYVTYDAASGKYSVDGSKFKLGNHRWIYEDGSPFIGIADGKPNASTLSIAAPAELGTPNGGKATMSFRFGFDSGEADSLIGSVINIPTTIGGSTVSFGQNLISWNNISVKFDEGTTVTKSLTSQLVGKTYNTVGIFDNTDSFDRLGVIGSGVWRDVVVEYDYDADTARLYYNGKPVIWTVTSGGVTKYSSEIDISSMTTFPGLSLTADRFYQYHDTNIMLDDLTWTYMSREEKEALVYPTWTKIANDQIMSSVTEDLNLIESVNVDGKAIPVVWTSSNETVISEQGIVTRARDTKYVTLTATIGDVVRTFDLVVPGKAEGVTAVSYSFDDGNIDGMTESSTAANVGTDYVITKDSTDSCDNKVMLFDAKIGYRFLSDAEMNELIANGLYFKGTDNADWYVFESEPRTDASGNRYFTGYRSNRKPYCSVLYVVEEDGKWVVDTSKASTWDRSFDEDGNKATAVTNNLKIAAPKAATVADGLYSMSFRFAEPNSNTPRSEGGSFTFQTGSTNIIYLNRASIGVHSSMRPSFVYDDSTKQVSDATSTTLIGKTADLTGNVSAADKDSKLQALTTRAFDEWVDIEVKYDFNTDTSRMYYNGKPVYWAVTVGGTTKYCSDMVIADLSVPYISFNATTALNNEFMVDDVKLTYTSAQQQADILAGELPYVKAGVLETDLVLGDNAAVTYTADKFTVDGANATINSSIGFGNEEDIITATATVNGKTAIKEHNVTLKKRMPYVVNSLVMTKDGNRIYAPVAGAVIEKIIFEVNDNAKTGVAAYIAKYVNGNFTDIVKCTVSPEGEALVNLTLSEGETYKIFTFDDSLVACNLVKTLSSSVKENVKLFVVGDGVSKSAAAKLGEKFTENVTVDYSQALIGASAKTALSGGSLEYAVANGTEGDYVIIGLGINDTKDATVAEYKVLLAQMIKAAENNGMTAILVTPVSSASDYTVAMRELAEKYGVVCIDASSLGVTADGDIIDSREAQTVAGHIVTGISATLLPIASYIK